MTQHTEVLQTLYEEMLARIKETDLSVPYRKGDYYYYSRTESGKAPTVAKAASTPRRSTTRSNELAQGHEYFSLGVFEVSPNHQLLAYSVDTSGAEQYTLFFLDLTTFQLYPECITETYFSFAWGNDNRTGLQPS